jgi:cystathionine beta-lyase
LDESLIQNSISLVSPSKTFNLAVLHAATAITPNENLRQRLQVAVGTNGHAEPGVLAINASIAAYTKGHDWLDQLREYVGKNRELLTEFVKDNLPDVTVVKGDATYLAWIDVTKISHDSAELNDFLRQETGLYLAEGTKYKGNGNDFLRMNLATTRSRVEDGLNRLKTGLEKYQAKH